MPQKTSPKRTVRPAQRQRPPGIESKMKPAPRSEDRRRRGSKKLEHKVALITGGDSGIGRAVAIEFAKEGADVAIVYVNEHGDAKETRRLVEEHGHRCLLIAGDVGYPAFCRKAVKRTIAEFGKLDTLVNNAAEQHPRESIDLISPRQLERTFRTNIFSFFYHDPGGTPSP